MSDPAAPHNDDRSIIEAGYKPQLKRGLHFFANFSVGFSTMSVLTGLFANYGFVLQKAGTFGMWSWWLVVIGHTLISLVFAEMASRIALAGSAYNWNTRLASPFVGWMTGWMFFVLYAVGIGATSMTLMPVLQSLLGIKLGSISNHAVCIGLIILQAFCNAYSVRLTSKINLIAVTAEIAALFGFGFLVAAVAVCNHHANISCLTQPPHDFNLQTFLMACLMGIWTFMGFEASADMGEETVNVHKVAPRGVVWSMLVGGLVGFLFLAAFTMAIPNLAQITASSDPLSDIAQGNLGNVLTKLFLVFVAISIFACALMQVTISSRMAFAMSRDKKFPCHKFLSEVSSHKVPERAIWLVAVIGIISALLSEKATTLAAAQSILGVGAYLITVLSFAFGHKKVAKKDTFSLGIWHWPVIILASTWLIIEVCILTIPQEFHPVALTAACILITGVIAYQLFGRKKKIS